MTIERLEQYAALKREIKSLERRITKAQASGGGVTDTVTASMKNFPYIQRPIKIVGSKAAGLTRTLENRLDRLERETEEVESWLDSVGDSEMRQIIQYRYVDGLTWIAVSNRVYGYPSENKARLKLKRFFEKNSS